MVEVDEIVVSVQVEEVVGIGLAGWRNIAAELPLELDVGSTGLADTGIGQIFVGGLWMVVDMLSNAVGNFINIGLG